MNIAMPSGLGAIVAVVVLILAIVFGVIGTLPVVLACLIAGLAIARLC